MQTEVQIKVQIKGQIKGQIKMEVKVEIKVKIQVKIKVVFRSGKLKSKLKCKLKCKLSTARTKCLVSGPAGKSVGKTTPGLSVRRWALIKAGKKPGAAPGPDSFNFGRSGPGRSRKKSKKS